MDCGPRRVSVGCKHEALLLPNGNEVYVEYGFTDKNGFHTANPFVKIKACKKCHTMYWDYHEDYKEKV